MMQVTGSNNTNIRAVSIQRDLNGLSFFDTSGNAIAKSVELSKIEDILAYLKRLRKLSSKIVVIIATDNFATIPSDLYLTDRDDLYFSAKSLPYYPDDLTYFRCRVDNFILVSAIESGVADMIFNLFNSITYIHSLVKAVEVAKSRGISSIALYETSRSCSIALVVNSKLYFAEHMVVNTRADLFYYLKKILASQSTTKIVILCCGEQKRVTYNALSQKFQNIHIV